MPGGKEPNNRPKWSSQATLCFYSCHLAAHEGEKMTQRRNADCREVLRGTKIGPHGWLEAAYQFDHCFFIGDLNYR